MKSFRLLTSFGLVFALASTGMSNAVAQTEEPELIPERVVQRGGETRGLRIARTGALLFASFDSDASLTVSPDEIIAGAKRSFASADKDGSGVVSIFEQQDWAAALGEPDGPLGNTLTFDSNIDRMVTEQEFLAGIQRLSAVYLLGETTEIRFSELIKSPRSNGKDDRKDKDEREKERPARGEDARPQAPRSSVLQ